MCEYCEETGLGRRIEELRRFVAEEEARGGASAELKRAKALLAQLEAEAGHS